MAYELANRLDEMEMHSGSHRAVFLESISNRLFSKGFTGGIHECIHLLPGGKGFSRSAASCSQRPYGIAELSHARPGVLTQVSQILLSRIRPE